MLTGQKEIQVMWELTTRSLGRTEGCHPEIRTEWKNDAAAARRPDHDVAAIYFEGIREGRVDCLLRQMVMWGSEFWIWSQTRFEND